MPSGYAVLFHSAKRYWVFETLVRDDRSIKYRCCEIDHCYGDSIKTGKLTDLNWKNYCRNLNENDWKDNPGVAFSYAISKLGDPDLTKKKENTNGALLLGLVYESVQSIFSELIPEVLEKLIEQQRPTKQRRNSNKRSKRLKLETNTEKMKSFSDFQEVNVALEFEVENDVPNYPSIDSHNIHENDRSIDRRDIHENVLPIDHQGIHENDLPNDLHDIQTYSNNDQLATKLSTTTQLNYWFDQDFFLSVMEACDEIYEDTVEIM